MGGLKSKPLPCPQEVASSNPRRVLDSLMEGWNTRQNACGVSKLQPVSFGCIAPASRQIESKNRGRGKEGKKSMITDRSEGCLEAK